MEAAASLRPSRDARIVPYSLIAAGGLAAALIAGQPALAALAVPFALALALGLRRIGSVDVRARFTLGAEQVLEGDVVSGRIEMAWQGAFAGEVMLHRLNGVTPVPDGELMWPVPPGSSAADLPVELQATQWGRHTPAEVWLRLEAPFGLVTWTGRVMSAPTLRVLPGNDRLTRLLDPSEFRVVLGMHRSRRLGAGTEFAELRPYTPGDRLRDLNWSATARHGRPFVNRRHPERSGDVVIAIDAFADESVGSTEALRRAARAAWALASVHLAANDRVGLAGLGLSTRWLAPANGRLARYQLLETLLRIGGEAVDPATALRARQTVAVPASALIIALTPLHDPATVATLESWRARGRSVAVVLVDTSDLLEASSSVAESLALRLWRIEIDCRRRELGSLGIPVVTAPPDVSITPIVSALRRARRAPSVRARR